MTWAIEQNEQIQRNMTHPLFITLIPKWDPYKAHSSPSNAHRNAGVVNCLPEEWQREPRRHKVAPQTIILPKANRASDAWLYCACQCRMKSAKLPLDALLSAAICLSALCVCACAETYKVVPYFCRSFHNPSSDRARHDHANQLSWIWSLNKSS